MSSWRIRNLFLGLISFMMALVVVFGIIFVDRYVLPVSWNFGTIVIVGALALGSVGASVINFLPLIDETEDDRRHMDEVKRVEEETRLELERIRWNEPRER